jgi:hypothetical protein
MPPIDEACHTRYTFGPLLEQYAEILHRRDEVQAALFAVRQELDTIEAAIKDAMHGQGMGAGDKVAASGITCTLRDKWRTKYVPEKWESILRWAVNTGHEYIVQRRTSDTKIVAFVAEGGTLPDGLGLESYLDLDFRRSA